VSTDDALIDECGKDEVSDEPLPTPALDLDLYGYFLVKLESATYDAPLTAENLQEQLGLVKTQLNEWLKRAVSEGRVKKSGKPGCYEIHRNEHFFKRTVVPDDLQGIS
jgi:hypothetical protein